MFLLGERTARRADELHNSEQKRAHNSLDDHVSVSKAKKKKVIQSTFNNRPSSPQPGPSGLQRYESDSESESEIEKAQWTALSTALIRRLEEKTNTEKEYDMLIKTAMLRTDSTRVPQCSSDYSDDDDESRLIDGIAPEEEKILHDSGINPQDFSIRQEFIDDEEITDNDDDDDDQGMLNFLVVNREID